MRSYFAVCDYKLSNRKSCKFACPDMHNTFFLDKRNTSNSSLECSQVVFLYVFRPGALLLDPGIHWDPRNPATVVYSQRARWTRKRITRTMDHTTHSRLQVCMFFNSCKHGLVWHLPPFFCAGFTWEFGDRFRDTSHSESSLLIVPSTSLFQVIGPEGCRDLAERKSEVWFL